MRGKSRAILLMLLKLITFILLVNALVHMDTPKSDIRETLESLGEKMMGLEHNMGQLDLLD